MSKRLRKHAPTLGYLAKCDRNYANAIIKGAKSDLIHCLSDVCHNVLRGNVTLSKAEKLRLKRYKNHIRKVADKNTTAKNKRTLIQKGGFLGALLTPLLQVIGPMLKSLVTG